MPLRPRKPCDRPGCGNLAEPGQRYCKAHAGYQAAQHRQYEQRRGTSAQRGYGYKWQQYCKQYLALNPWCIECMRQGRGYVVAKHVDHIVPVTGPDDPRFWDPSNHQGLCHSCHSSKTASENCGFGNPRRGRG